MHAYTRLKVGSWGPGVLYVLWQCMCPFPPGRNTMLLVAEASSSSPEAGLPNAGAASRLPPLPGTTPREDFASQHIAILE